MLLKWMSLNADVSLIIGTICGFLITFFFMWKPMSFLPRDGGKKVETPDGKIVVINEKSNGKVTGIGLFFISVFLLMSLLFLPSYGNVELVLNVGLIFLMMLTGYLDDASSVPWGELIKGLLDLVIAIAAVLIFLHYHEPDVIFFGQTIHMPDWLYGILGVILIWASVNVTNCSDGVDGLCGSVSVIELAAYYLIFRNLMPEYASMGILLIGCLLAYLIFNWNPSKVLMGDAGSRPIGFLLALLAMHSTHPFIFLLMSLVFLFDGGIGLLKMTIIRVFHRNPLDKLLTPFHDHMRKRMGLPIKSIPLIFSGCEALFCLVSWLIVR